MPSNLILYIQGVPKLQEELVVTDSLQYSETETLIHLCRVTNRFQA